MPTEKGLHEYKLRNQEHESDPLKGARSQEAVTDVMEVNDQVHEGHDC